VIDEDLQLIRDLADHWRHSDEGMHMFPRVLQYNPRLMTPSLAQCRRMGEVLAQLLTEHDERTPA
jgi:hypothetical protein